MKIISQIKDLREALNLEREKKRSIGFVPTMGYLHEGHLSLIQEARENNDIVVISIFVNPLQFGPSEDYDKYPRDMERDQELAQNAGVDYLFYPTVQEMYGDKQNVTVKVHERTDVMCGKSRPGHFDGVATVLTKLFTIVQPNRAYFGMKDAQQVAVVEGLIHDFNFPIELVGVQIKREEDGLALSSRNINLTEQEREEAPFIYKSLCKVEEELQKGVSPTEALELGKTYLESHISGKIDYFECLSYPELSEITEQDQKIIFAVAVQYTSVRLIDNIIINL
jgi:pantoate--beta-alanine ligase